MSCSYVRDLFFHFIVALHFDDKILMLTLPVRMSKSYEREGGQPRAGAVLVSMGFFLF